MSAQSDLLTPAPPPSPPPVSLFIETSLRGAAPVSLQLLAVNHRRWLASAGVDVRSASLVVKVVVGGAMRVQGHNKSLLDAKGNVGGEM